MARVSSKHQVTIPVSALREAGLGAGDDVVVRAAGPGRVTIDRVGDLVDRLAGTLPDGTVPPGGLDALRDEWDR
jgi:bifunctional DNA-binding transcriptional regulator/antitoxin component of YhaV-PrlF toxin-antitoxin module